MEIPELHPRTFESDPHKVVALVHGRHIYAECAYSEQKKEIGTELAMRSNRHTDLVNALEKLATLASSHPFELNEHHPDVVHAFGVLNQIKQESVKRDLLSWGW